MSNLAVNRPSISGTIARSRFEQPELLNGQVAAMEDGSFLVSTPAGLLSSRRAASCLLDPKEKDHVLLAHSRDTNWILAVLERPGEQAATLSFTESVQINAPHGSIHFTAAETISTSSPTLGVQAETASGVFGTIDIVASIYRSCIDSASVVMQKMNTFCRSVQQHFVRSVKRVDGYEDEYAAARTIQGGTVDIVTNTTEIKAGGRVSVNASQYHVN